MRSFSVSRTDVGRKRQANEDTVFADDDLGLYIVCDGMGGHEGGAIASKMACEAVAAAFREDREFIVRARTQPELADGVRHLAQEAIRAASAKVYAAEEPDKIRRMGTTLTLLQVLGSRALIAHVGDSRAYLVRQENLHLMTADHTGAAELMRGMKWSETQAMKSPFSSVLTRAVGTESSVEVDTLIFDIFSEDRLLLCSDGLTHHVHDRDELRGLLDQPFDSTATLLIDRANEAGGRDNISAIVVRIEGEDDEPGPHRVNQHESELSALAQAFGFEAIRLRPLQRLLNLARRRALDPGEVVAERGEAFDRLILVVSGELELVREESRLSSVGPGQSVGRRLLFEPGAIQASLRAVEPSTVLEIESEGFWGVMRWHPVLSLKVLSRAAWLGHQRVQRLVHEGLPPEPEDLF